MTELKKPKPCINGCGKDVKNQGAHDRFCQALTKKVEADAITIKHAEPEPQPETEKPFSLNITDINKIQTPDIYSPSQLAAWFHNPETGKPISRIPEFMGMLHTGDVNLMSSMFGSSKDIQHIPCALLCTVDGIFMPVFMIAGFIGMYPQNTEWPEPDQSETSPPFPVEEEKTEPEPILIKPTDTPVKAKKPGIFNALFKGRKEPKTHKEVNETLDLINEAINASKT